jgi:uncharacterized membrane protein YdcZ (DUF606 family)
MGCGTCRCWQTHEPVTGVLLAATAGVAIALQVALVGRAAETRSAIAIAMFVQLGGLVAALTILVLRGRFGEITAAAGIPWLWIPAGIAGTIIVSSLASASSQIGVAAALGVSVAVQLAASLAWDVRWQLVARPTQAAVGIVLLGAGAWLVATARA